MHCPWIPSSPNRNNSRIFIASIVDIFQNVESTGKLEISLDVLNNDALLKKLNESTISIHTVEIQPTCQVHQVLTQFSIQSFLEVLRIKENSLNFKDLTILLKFLHSVNYLHELDLCRTKFTEGTFFVFISALNYCKNLTTLILTDNSLTKQEIDGLITVLESVKNVKILNLSKCILTETQANAILHKHEQAKNIVSLDLSQNAIQGNEIVVGICQLQSLEELNLSHNLARFSPLPDFRKRNHLSKCLKKISLSSNHMKPDDIWKFSSLIRSDLLELNLDFNIVDHSVWSLCSLGEKIKHLKVLSLANTNMCHNVDGLAFLLSLVRELEDLNLSCNNLLAKDFQQLQTTLSKLSQLKTLNLSMNAIGSDGMKAFAHIFKEFPLLEHLDMNSSYIREDEVSVLCESLVSLKKLKYLNLSGNIIDVEVLDDALILPATLEELLFSDVIHGEKLFDEMSQLQNLKKLHFNKLMITGCDVEALALMLSSFSRLEELSLASLAAPDCKTILTAIKSLKNIRKIDLTGIKLSNEEALVDMLLSLTSLEELVLTDMNGRYMDYNKLFGAIKLLKRLRKLSLGGVKVFGGVNALSDMLSSLLNLEDIVLPDGLLNSFSDYVPGCFSALESLRYIRSLDLLGTIIFEPITGALARVLPSLQLLEKLRLNLEFCSDKSPQNLFAAFRKLKCLKELSVNIVGVHDKTPAIETLAEVLPSLQLLRTLHLVGFFCRTEKERKQLFGALRELGYLKELSCFSLINADTEAFADALPSLPLLEKLAFEIRNFSNNEYAEQLHAALGKFKYLRKLEYCLFKIGDSELEALAKVLLSLELLEELTLNGTWWEKSGDGEHKKNMFSAISKLKYLKKLDLSIGEYFIYTEGALSKMLPSLQLLEKLKLKEINLKNGNQVKELFIALGKLKNLRKVDLYWQKITQTNVDALAKTLASLQVLEELTLWVYFYCNHDCDDDSDNECDHNCEDECWHNPLDGCRDEESDYDCYDRTCNKCRHDEYERLVNSVKTKVFSAVQKLKYFKTFTLDGDDITETARKAST